MRLPRKTRLPRDLRLTPRKGRRITLDGLPREATGRADDAVAGTFIDSGFLPRNKSSLYEHRDSCGILVRQTGSTACTTGFRQPPRSAPSWHGKYREAGRTHTP